MAQLDAAKSNFSASEIIGQMSLSNGDDDVSYLDRENSPLIIKTPSKVLLIFNDNDVEIARGWQKLERTVDSLGGPARLST